MSHDSDPDVYDSDDPLGVTQARAWLAVYALGVIVFVAVFLVYGDPGRIQIGAGIVAVALATDVIRREVFGHGR